MNSTHLSEIGRSMTKCSYAIAMAFVIAGCSASSSIAPYDEAKSFEDELTGEAGEFRRLAWIHFGQGADTVVFQVPASAKAGVPVEAAITTYGGGCIKEDTTVVSVSGMSAEIVPIQLVRMQGACTAELRVTRRSVKMVFPEAGVATVRVTGRANPGDSLIAVRRRIQVTR